MDSKRKRTSRSQTTEGESTPRQNSPAQNPLFTELQKLNDRLAAHIARIIQLDMENSRLNGEIRNNIVDHMNMAQNSNINEMVETALVNARKVLDDIAKKKARLELKNKYLSDENAKLNIYLEKKAKELYAVQQLRRHYLGLKEKFNFMTTDYEKAVGDGIEREHEVVQLKTRIG